MAVTDNTLRYFREGVMNDFCRHVRRENLRSSPIELLSFLIDKGYIPSHHIRNKAVLSAFTEVNEPEMKRHTAVIKISARTDVSERTVGRVLRSQQGLYK